MSKAKSFKKTIVVAAAAGMMITTSIGTVSAGQIYSDSTVGISSAFDRYANTLAGNDKTQAMLQRRQRPQMHRRLQHPQERMLRRPRRTRQAKRTR